MDTQSTAGYFTWLGMIYGKPAARLAADLGFAAGSLDAGWLLLMPRWPIAPANLDLRGTTRWPDGVLPNGNKIADMISQRTDIEDAKRRVVAFFDRRPEHRTAKVHPLTRPGDYPPASPVGVPQFKLLFPVEWVVVKTIDRAAF
jgi:hypothetical protein